MLAVALLTACGGDKGTAPEPNSGGGSAAISLALTVTGAPAYAVAAPGIVTSSCVYQINATNSGALAGTILDGVLRLASIADSATVLDSLPLSATDIGNFFTSPTIAPAATVRGALRATYVRPFFVEAEFRYAVAGVPVAARARVRQACGPRPPTGVSAPAVGALQEIGPRSVVATGDVITLTYRATAAAGLFSTFVRFDGPCSGSTTRAAGLALALVDTVRVVLPGTCFDGVPMSFALRAVDATGRAVDTAIVGPTRTRDLTPPHLDETARIGQSRVEFGPPPFEVFEGDSIQAAVIATDSGRLQSVVLRTGPVFDSLAITNPLEVVSARPIILPAGPSPLVTFSASDVSGNVGSLVLAPLGVVSALPRTVVSGTAWALPSGVQLLAADAAHQRLFVTRPGSLVALDAATGATLFSVPMAVRPQAMSVTPSGDTVVVLPEVSTDLLLVNVRTNTPVTSRRHVLSADSVAQLDQFIDVVALANGRVLLSAYVGAHRVYEVDLVAGTSRGRPDSPSDAWYFSRSPDGMNLMMWRPSASQAVYRVSTDTIQLIGIGGPAAGAASVSATGLFSAGVYILGPASFTNGVVSANVDPTGTRSFLGDGSAIAWTASQGANALPPTRSGFLLVNPATGHATGVVQSTCLGLTTALLPMGPRSLLAISRSQACLVSLP